MGKRVECARGRRPERGHVHLTVLYYCSIHARTCCNMNEHAACSCINLHNSQVHLVHDAVRWQLLAWTSIYSCEGFPLSAAVHTRHRPPRHTRFRRATRQLSPDSFQANEMRKRNCPAIQAT